MRIQPEISVASIVLVGAFDPRILVPQWFAKREIIGEIDAAAAKIDIIHESIAAYSFDWADIRVDPNRLVMVAKSPPFIRSRDLIVRTFKEFLHEIPIAMIGINRAVHFRVGSIETRDKMGQRLAPQSAWGEWSKMIAGDPTRGDVRGGLLSLSMTQRDRQDDYTGAITARVEPSGTFRIDGVFVEVNDHYSLAKADETIASDRAVQVLETQWDRSIERSEWIIDQVMALAEKVAP